MSLQQDLDDLKTQYEDEKKIVENAADAYKDFACNPYSKTREFRKLRDSETATQEEYEKDYQEASEKYEKTTKGLKEAHEKAMKDILETAKKIADLERKLDLE